MSEETARLRLPLIAAAQAQKHVTHNEALVVLDTLVQASVLDKDLTTPPGSPAEGDCYIVAATATGAWSGWETRLVRFIDGVWRSYLPRQGWLVYAEDESELYVFNGSAWVPFGSAVYHPLDAELTALAGLAPADDDIIQRKAGVWDNRTLAQLMADLGALGQIPFPATQNPSADPNTLDDYEEGTYTPAFVDGEGNPTVVSMSAYGFYNKVGKRVYFALSIWDLDTHDADGGAYITLPFPVAYINGGNYPIFILNFSGIAFVGTGFVASGFPGYAYVAMYGQAVPPGSYTALELADIADGAEIYITGAYLTDD